MSNFTVVVQN
jgi:hypothetical protein